MALLETKKRSRSRENLNSLWAELLYTIYGDNTVQGYGQIICLKSAILDFPGRELQQTA